MTSATDAGHRGHERGSTPAGLAQSNYVQFANGINGDEDLGQNIIMKDKQLHKIKIIEKKLLMTTHTLLIWISIQLEGSETREDYSSKDLK